MADLFPSQKLSEGPLTVVTLAFKTTNDMSTWSEEMEDEREQLTEHMVITAKEICGRLKDEGFWADFIDPCSGTPHYSGHSSTTMMETDEKYRLLGYRIEDLGCCKVISHREFGRHVFVGTIFTDAHPSSGVVQDIFTDMRVSLGGKSSQIPDDSIETSNTILATSSTVKQNTAALSKE